MATILQFQYYRAVVQQQGFTAAADTLFVSQPALSKSIRALEQEFQVELIDRSVKTFRLTPEGELFYDYALEILSHFQNQVDELYQRLHGSGGVLRFGLPPTAGSIYFYSCIQEFKKRYPQTELKLVEFPSKTILKQLDEKKLDMACVLEPFHDSRYHVRPVFTSELMLVVSTKHPLAGRDAVSFTELKDEPFLMMSPNYTFHDMVIGCCQSAGFTPNVVFESSQWDLVSEMAVDNQGITFFAKALLDKYAPKGVCVIPLKEATPPWVLSLIYRKDKFMTPQMQHFLDICMKSRAYQM